MPCKANTIPGISHMLLVQKGMEKKGEDGGQGNRLPGIEVVGRKDTKM